MSQNIDKTKKVNKRHNVTYGMASTATNVLYYHSKTYRNIYGKKTWSSVQL